MGDRITVYPNVEIDYLKVDKDITKTYAEATASKKMSSSSVAFIDFVNLATSSIDAKYYDSTLSSEGTYIFYKKVPNQNYYNYVCTLKDDDTIFFDYNVKSNQFYHYIAAVEQKNSQGINEYTIYESVDDESRDEYFKVNINSWTICNIEETDQENIYNKTGRTWNLGLNLGDEQVTLNFSATTWETLGKYPKISYGEKNYDSMSFSGLLGSMQEYTDYEFGEEGNIYSATTNDTYRYTEKLERFIGTDDDGPVWGINKQIGSNYYQYSTENEKLEAWKEFINDGELKLIRDMKGNAWIAQVADSSSYTINNNSNIKQTTINFTWKEVASTEGVSIIKVGTDFSSE